MSMTMATMLMTQQLQDQTTAQNMMAQSMQQIKEQEDRTLGKMHEDQLMTQVELLKGNSSALNRLSFS